MRNVMLIMVCSLMVIAGQAQSYEVQCLVLDCSKLAQLKSILSDMKKGYQILTQGYGAVKDISEGNFHLHEVFLDNLMKASPAVRKYGKVADMISDQLAMMKEYRSAWQRFRNDARFTPDELEYLVTVYSHLIQSSLSKLDDLTTILTDGSFRMSDEERLNRIDELAADMHDKLTFLRHFNGNASVLALQRTRQQNDINTSARLYGIK
ncbi:MAG: TerB family tellurite resistance protein [Williamsia sp.]|nr:TerB family tellurite resistance protein [Williamsia sp.]